MRCLLALSLVALAALSVEAGLQNVTVKGIAICNKKRMGGITVKLYEKDRNSFDDLLKEVTTNEQGEFEVYGEESEVLSIEPYLIIVHPCGAKPGCNKHTPYPIDKKHIGKTYDMTYVPLDIKQHDEKEKC